MLIHYGVVIASHFPIPIATTLTGQKESVYSIVMNDSGTVLVSGSTEKVSCY